MITHQHRVLIIGCGRIAGGFNDADERNVLTHVAAYRRMGAALVGCCDVDAKKAERFARRWSIPVYGADLESLLALTLPEVVSICTPPHGRVPVVRSVLSTKSVRTVLIEKPVGDNFEDASRILRLAQNSGCAVLVNYFRAFDPFYRDLARQCAAGTLGVLCEATVRYYGSAKANASHMLERLLAMFGQPVAVHNLSGESSSPVFEMSFRDPHARAIFLPTSGCEYAPLELDLLFERGRIRVVDSERRVEEFVSQADPDFKGFYNLVSSGSQYKGTLTHEGVLYAVEAVLDAAQGEAIASDGLERAVLVTHILDTVGAC